MDKACFGAGCFWGVEVEFCNLEGVLETTVGYMGGDVADPTYEQVCTGRTGHAEVCHVVFDRHSVGYNTLLDLFWAIHDPTQKDRQGFDVGRQYRSVIFAFGEEQLEMAMRSKLALDALDRYDRPIVTQIEPAANHQRYLVKRGMATCRI